MAGVRPGCIIRDLSRGWLLFTLTFFIHWIINSQFLGTKGDSTIFYLRSSQVLIAMRFTLRFALIIATISALNRLHDMQRYGKAIGRLFAKSPIGRSTFAQLELAATLALRMIPFVQRQYHQLELALAARGKRTPPYFARLHNSRRLMFPLVVESLHRADRAALALQARGYDPAVARTYYHSAERTLRQELIGFAVCSASLVTLLL
jgi:energy-coupling factor transporter transmembrane protein EcfT